MKIIRKLVQSVLLLLSLGAALFSSSLRAEDIDIYFDNSAGGELPKVLFMIDNSSNVGSDWGSGCTGYADGSGAPSMGVKTAGGIIQCALVDAISSLPDNTLDVAIMSGNANNFASSRGCVGSSGGCLLVPFTTVTKGSATTADTKTPLINFIKSWKHENSDTTGTFPFTVTNAESGGMMQEAYAYFYSKTGLSGRTYTKPWIQNCQKNFIIYIGNMDKSPANDDPSTAALVTAGAGDIAYGTGTLKDKITTTQKFDPAICSNPKSYTSLAAGSSKSDWSSNSADEWARFLQFKDGGTETQLGKQNITTYTIGIINNASNQCTADYPALMQSMAKVSGGVAYRVGDAGAVKEAVALALNEAQAVNSVFSSASLPVSVNAEGSYLNQIFLGMFRPDRSGAPRWLGNLKQYQLIRDSSGNLVMGDACNEAGCPKPAINSSTGFLSPNAISFWTYKDTANLPDSAGGFFVNDPKGEPQSGFDRADGEVVEKGGVAQQLRKQNLTATFVGASGTSVNPRRVYTYCPKETGCEKDLLHADNDFATTNTNFLAKDFGGSVTVGVESIVRNGPVATVTTRTAHSFKTGSLVTITGASPPEYNLNGTITLVSGSATKFTMAIKDWPTPTSEDKYTVSVPGSSGSKTITTLQRATRVGPTVDGTELVTVTTSGDHGFVANQTVTISGSTATDYNNRTWTIDSVPALNQFTFKATITPVSPTQNSYQAAHIGSTSWDFTGISPSGGSSKVSTASVHTFKQGQTVKITGLKGQDASYYDNKEFQITSVGTDGRSFFFATPTGATKNTSGGTVGLSTALKSVTITRTTTAVTGATATVSAPASWFADGNKVAITTTGTAANESAYVKQATITCTVTDCSKFTYPIDVTPAVSGTGGSVSVTDAGTAVNIDAGAIVRTGTTAVVTLPSGSVFSDGAMVTISPVGTGRDSEAGYVNTWKITCVGASPCSKFSIGPIPLSPPLAASGANIQAFSGNTPPDLVNLVKWLRGEDNHGDEKSPAPGTITVRPSIHGDVLHSRPLVINYGDSRGIVVFYGSNDGVYRAVNGNQSGSSTDSGVTVPAGGEFWGLILQEHYGRINRYRSNLPEIKYPGTFSETAQPKNYFVDGPTGVYQKIDANGVITDAIIYLTMRRGGRFLYAIDVTHPGAPKVKFRLSADASKSDQPGYEELGYTWSRPRVTLLQNYKTTTVSGTPVIERIPVLVFGAGYDLAQDSEPPITEQTQPPAENTMGRGIFVVNAITGEKIFSASASCPVGSDTCRKVADMKHATPSDIAFVDRDLDGFTDKFYWGDLGGNLWRLDVASADVGQWTVTKVAALGCDTGECSVLKTPRKFFYPPAVLTVRPAGNADSYDLLSIVSGDREHPLSNDVENAAYRTNDRFFMIKDFGTTPGVTTLNTANVVPNQLFNATYTQWDKSNPGFYINFIGRGWSETTNQPDSSKTPTLGEKAVNAPVAVNGQVFFATNQPKEADGTCVSNLGTARAYAVNPFTGQQVQNELQGGGMPPSAVSGLISITETKNGETTTTQEKFCIGCGISGTQVGGTNDAPCTSALENCNIGAAIPKNLKRTYWYKK